MSRAVVAGLLVVAVGAAAGSARFASWRLQTEKVEAAKAQAMTLEQMSEAPLVARKFYGRRLEPQASVVLHGAGQSDGASFAAYTVAMGSARPMLSMSYVDLHDDLPAYFARERAELAKYPELILPQIGLSMNAGAAKTHYEQEVADGVDDSRLKVLCDGLRSLGRPVFLRLGYEFNGPWNGYSPMSYVAAFRHVAQAVRGCGLENVAMVWDWSADQELDAEAGGADPSGAAARRDAYYPGDAWVDWWAINLFSAKSLTASLSREFLEEADRHRFPVMIAESTPFHHSVSEGKGVIDAWYAPYFGLIRSSSGIKAFCYIDWDWSAYPQWADWGDGRVEKNAAVLGFYRAQVGSKLFAGAAARAQTTSLLRAR